MNNNAHYSKYLKAIKGMRLPLAFLDLEMFDRNIAYVADTQRGTNKTIRVGSKSVRCLALLRRIFDIGGNSYRGILSFTVEETAFLCANGFDDIIVAYPSVQQCDLELLAELTTRGKTVSLMADSREQLDFMNRTGMKAGLKLKACIDVDMSYRLAGSKIHLGVRRSPLRTAEEVIGLARYSKTLPGVMIDSLMGYEAHIASLMDAVPGQSLKNAVIRGLKNISVGELTARRDSIVKTLIKEGINLRAVNGGGSGSLVSSGSDPALTEVTAGSAFFSPALFSHFREVSFMPAAFFALQAVRAPAPGIITCHGGGYTASGSAGADKLPVCVYPEGLKLLPLEGAGEVQTPLCIIGGNEEPDIGSIVLFRHAKAGELCERFNEIHLVRDGMVIDTVRTYRGEGLAFL